MRNYTSSNFHVSAYQKHNLVLITQQIFHPACYTDELFATLPVLTQSLPAIFNHHCDNDKHLPFKEEVRTTEVGHLLEHIILEYLTKNVFNKYGHADFSGETSWDWSKTPSGVFQIIIYSNSSYGYLFHDAFYKAVLLLDYIYTVEKQNIIS